MPADWAELPDTPTSIEEFDTMREAFHASTDDLLVRGVMRNWDLSQLINNQTFCSSKGFACVSFDTLGIDAPPAWADELAEIAASGERYRSGRDQCVPAVTSTGVIRVSARCRLDEGPGEAVRGTAKRAVVTGACLVKRGQSDP